MEQMSAKDKELQEIRKELKNQASGYHNAKIQENFLQACWNRNITPRGLILTKKCVAFRARQTKVTEEFREILKEAEGDVSCSLMQHLRQVSDNYHSAVNTSLKSMSRVCHSANTSELINHERFWSATKANIEKFKAKKHHSACNKINELTNRGKDPKSRDFLKLIKSSHINWDHPKIEDEPPTWEEEESSTRTQQEKTPTTKEYHANSPTVEEEWDSEEEQWKETTATRRPEHTREEVTAETETNEGTEAEEVEEKEAATTPQL